MPRGISCACSRPRSASPSARAWKRSYVTRDSWIEAATRGRVERREKPILENGGVAVYPVAMRAWFAAACAVALCACAEGSAIDTSIGEGEGGSGFGGQSGAG